MQSCKSAGSRQIAPRDFAADGRNTNNSCDVCTLGKQFCIVAETCNGGRAGACRRAAAETAVVGATLKLPIQLQWRTNKTSGNDKTSHPSSCTSTSAGCTG